MRKSFELAFQLAKAEFKIKNEGSYLGILWYLLNPILTFLILYLVFSNRLGETISSYPLYLLFGVTMFNLFQGTTIEASRSLLREFHYLIKSIQFPRESLIFAIVLRNIFSHGFEIALILIIMLYFHAHAWSLIWYLPILALLAGFLYGTSLLVSALTVYFADLDNIWNFATRIVWFGTPIFYAIEPGTKLMYANLANPMYYFITLARDLVIYERMPSPIIWIGSIAFSIGTLAIGIAVFSRLKKHFAEKF